MIGHPRRSVCCPNHGGSHKVEDLAVSTRQYPPQRLRNFRLPALRSRNQVPAFPSSEDWPGLSDHSAR
jgi:hypothetical protein